MKITTMQVSQSVAFKKFYSDYASPSFAKYEVDLNRQGPALRRRIDSLSPEERQCFASTFAATWNNLHPDTRRAIWGGAAGGTMGAGLALSTLGIKEIGRLIGGPVGFVVGVTAFGVAVGALTPKALDHFSQSSLEGEIKTPKLWNVVLPEVKLEFQGKTATASTKKKTTAAKSAPKAGQKRKA